MRQLSSTIEVITDAIIQKDHALRNKIVNWCLLLIMYRIFLITMPGHIKILWAIIALGESLSGLRLMWLE